MRSKDRPRHRILLVSDNPGVLEPTLHILRATGDEVISSFTATASSWLRMHRADLAVIDLSGDAGGASEVLRIVRSSSWSGEAKLLALVRNRGTAGLRSLFEDNHLTNFLGMADDGAPDPLELTVTVKKILNGDVFGMDKYLAEGAQILSFTIASSSERESIVDAARTFALQRECNPQIAESIATAVDEIMTNALYNSPADAGGSPRCAALPRSAAITLPENESVCIQIGADARRFAVAARDPFGSLSPRVVIDYLVRYLSNAERAPDEGKGGAGLGLYYVLNLVQHFVINIAVGRCTEVMGLLEVSRSYREFARRPKSFNLFVATSPS